MKKPYTFELILQYLINAENSERPRFPEGSEVKEKLNLTDIELKEAISFLRENKYITAFQTSDSVTLALTDTGRAYSLNKKIKTKEKRDAFWRSLYEKLLAALVEKIIWFILGYIAAALTFRTLSQIISFLIQSIKHLIHH